MTKTFATVPTRALLALGALALCSGFVSPANAEDALPSARQIVDRFVQTTKAASVLDAHDAMITTGSFSMPAQGMEGKMQIWTKAPDRMLVKIELPGFGEILQGFDGEVGWSLDPAQGAQLMEADALAQMRDQANFYGSLYREQDIQSFGAVEKVEFGGEAAYKVPIVFANGSNSTQYFSLESGLLIGREAVQKTPMGDIPVSSTVSDYVDFGGTLVPTKTVDSMMGMQQIISVESVRFEAVADEIFALPAAVAALVGAE